MGLAVMYDEVNADFKKMIRLGAEQNLYVSKILQKACIEVNEKGAEAAAVTGMCSDHARIQDRANV